MTPLLLLLAACVAPDESPCGVAVLATTPADGATDVFFHDPVTVTLDAPDATATLDLGVAGTSTLEDDDTLVRFVPAEPLGAETTYTATVHGCGGDTSYSFTTSAWGAPVAPDTLIDRAWVVELVDAMWTEPAGVAAVLRSFVVAQGQDILVGVVAAGADTLALLGALTDPDADGVAQDPDLATFDVDADFADDPWLEARGVELALPFEDTVVSFHDVTLGAAFSGDGGALGGGVIEATVDVAPLDALFGGDPGAACEVVASLDAQCGPCPDGVATTCVHVRGEQLGGVEVDVPLTRVP